MSDLSVLLVEDNHDDVELATWALEKIGLTDITVASDGIEALRIIHGDENSAGTAIFKPDLIILDLRLPKMDGLDVLRRIKADERTSKVKVFILTSSDDPMDRQVCDELGVPAFFQKPLKANAIMNLNLL